MFFSRPLLLLSFLLTFFYLISTKALAAAQLPQTEGTTYTFVCVYIYIYIYYVQYFNFSFLFSENYHFLVIREFNWKSIWRDFYYEFAVQSLRDIAKTLGKTNWNFSVDPCSGQYGWVTPNPLKGSENAVYCNCSFSNATVCHVTSMYVYYNHIYIYIR